MRILVQLAGRAGDTSGPITVTVYLDDGTIFDAVTIEGVAFGDQIDVVDEGFTRAYFERHGRAWGEAKRK